MKSKKITNLISVLRYTKNLTACLLTLYAAGVSAQIDNSKRIPVDIPSLSYDATLAPGGQYVGGTIMADIPKLGDNNTFKDVVLYFLNTKYKILVSKTNSGGSGNGDSFQPSVSNGGRFVSFTSSASNLVSDDTNNTYDVFVRDIYNKRTVRASVSSNGEQANKSSSGARIAQVWVNKSPQAIVAFTSSADNLVAGDTNGSDDVFIRNLSTSETKRVSVDSAGNQANGFRSIISDNGRYVGFSSNADTLKTNSNHSIDAYVHDMKTGATVSVSDNENPSVSNVTDEYYVNSITDNGKLVTVAHVWNYFLNGHPLSGTEYYLYDLVSKQRTTDINTSLISANSKYVTKLGVFEGASVDWGDYVVERLTGSRQQITSSFVTGSILDISADGKSILFNEDTIVSGFSYFVHRQ